MRCRGLVVDAAEGSSSGFGGQGLCRWPAGRAGQRRKTGERVWSAGAGLGKRTGAGLAASVSITALSGSAMRCRSAGAHLAEVGLESTLKDTYTSLLSEADLVIAEAAACPVPRRVRQGMPRH